MVMHMAVSWLTDLYNFFFPSKAVLEPCWNNIYVGASRVLQLGFQLGFPAKVILGLQ